MHIRRALRLYRTVVSKTTGMTIDTVLGARTARHRAGLSVQFTTWVEVGETDARIDILQSR